MKYFNEANKRKLTSSRIKNIQIFRDANEPSGGLYCGGS